MATKKGKSKRKKSAWAKSPKMAEFEDHRPFSQRFVHALIPLAVLLLVLYIAVQLLSRTEGCRVLVAERIEEHIQEPVSIDHIWTDWSLDLHIAGLRTEGGYRKALPGLEVSEVKVRWQLPSKSKHKSFVRQIDITGLKLSLVLDKERQWQPSPFAPLATWLVRWGRLNLVQAAADDLTDSDEALGKPTKKSAKSKSTTKGDGFWESVNVVLEDGEVRWWDLDGTEAASAYGIHLQSIPLSVPQRELHHYVVGIDKVSTSVGEQVKNLNFELITTMGHHIVLGFQADWAKGPTSFTRREKEPEPVANATPPEPQPIELSQHKAEVQPVETDRESAEELADYFRDMLEDALIKD